MALTSNAQEWVGNKLRELTSRFVKSSLFLLPPPFALVRSKEFLEKEQLVCIFYTALSPHVSDLSFGVQGCGLFKHLTQLLFCLGFATKLADLGQNQG